VLRAFLKDSVIYAIPALTSRGLSFFLIPLYTRVLSPANYGSLDLLIMFASIINLTIALEVSQGLARFYAGEQNPDHKVAYASSAFWFTLVCYSIFVVLALVFINPLAHWVMGQSGLETAFRISIVYIWVNGVFYLVQNQFRWELRSKNYAVVSLLMSLVTAGLSVWFTYGMGWGLTGLLLAMVVGTFFATMLGLWWLKTSFRFRFDFIRLSEMLRFSTPLVFSGVAVWISLYIDRIMINHFLSIDEVGLYGVGYRIASIAGLAMIGFQGALTPLVYANYKKPETPSHLAMIFRFFLIFALLLFLVLSLFSKEILYLFTTEAFFGASVVIIYLVPAILLSNMYIFAPGIAIVRKTQYILWINLIGALINIALNYILIPYLGIVGAAMATLLSYLGIFATYMVLNQKLYYVPHRWFNILIVTMIAATLAWLLPQLPLIVWLQWITYLLALVLFLVIALIFGLMQVGELKQGYALIKKKF
jgi:O-antigen/teichoic acid export membrane protein